MNYNKTSILVCIAVIILAGCIFVVLVAEKAKRKPFGNLIQEKNKSVLDMKLGETIKLRSKLASWIIVKVPGGWVYSNYYNQYLVFVKDEREEK